MRIVAAAVIRPKSGEMKFPLGLLRFTWLSTLNASARNCSLAWPSGMFFAIVMSTFQLIGPRTRSGGALPGRSVDVVVELVGTSVKALLFK